MTEPQRDHRAVEAGLQQFHRSAVPQHVRRHALALQRRATLVSDTNMLSQQGLDAIGTEQAPVHVWEQRCCSFPQRFLEPCLERAPSECGQRSGPLLPPVPAKTSKI
jgi:hypothetical protein